MKIAICDDQINELEKINQLVEEYCCFNKYKADIYAYSDVNSLMHHIDDINCLILDVLLYKTPGLEVARQIFQRNKDIKIIFCSTNPEYSLEAFEVNAFRYLVKPIDKLKLFGYLDEVRKYYMELSICVNDINHRQRTMSLFDVCYIDMQGRKSTIHLKDKTTIIMVRQMKEWISILDGLGFYLSHKGVLVNLKYVLGIEDDIVTLKNGESVYLSRSYRKDFQKAFFDMLGEIL